MDPTASVVAPAFTSCQIVARLLSILLARTFATPPPLPPPNPLSPLGAITSLPLISRLLIFALSEVLPLLGKQAHSDNVSGERACELRVLLLLVMINLSFSGGF